MKVSHLYTASRITTTHILYRYPLIVQSGYVSPYILLFASEALKHGLKYSDSKRLFVPPVDSLGLSAIPAALNVAVAAVHPSLFSWKMYVKMRLGI